MRFLTLLCALFLLNHSFSQLQLDYNSIPKELLKNADAVVRMDKMEVTIENKRLMKVVATRVVTVFNDDGNRYVHANSYYDDNHKIVDLSAIVYDASGREIKKFRKKDFLDRSASGSNTLYSDSRVKYLRYTPTAYPYTIKFSKSYQTPDTAFVPNWYFLDGYRVSTEKSSYILNLPAETPYRFKENNLAQFGVQSEKSSNRLRYTAKNIPAIEREPYSPNLIDFLPNVKFALEKFHLKGVNGTAKNWEEFGLWIYTSLLNGQGALAEETKIKIRKMVWGINDPKEKVKKVYEYVQNNTRYISVQLGIGGWKPISAMEVDKVKYGDCKGLTNYTMALLKEVGIESFYTVVYGDSRKRSLDKDFPSLQGNHVFLNIPLENEEIWLECTSQDVPPNYLGTFTDDRYVLKVTPKGGELVKSRKYEDTENVQSTNAKLRIDVSGGISADVEIISKGIQYDQKYRLISKKIEEQEEHYLEYWDYVNSLDVSSADFQNDKDKVELQEFISVKTDNYISKAGEKWLFAPNMFNRIQYVPKRLRERKREVIIRRGYLDEDDFVIELPEGVGVESLLPEMEVRTDFGEYSIYMEQMAENEIRYKRKLVINSGKYPKESYTDFRNFMKKIVRSDNAKIVLIKS